jgi:hypothetical protein
MSKQSLKNSQLYLLHIPKTGGTSVTATIRHSLNASGLQWHENTRPPHIDNYSKYVYIDAHLGLCKKIISPSTSVACLVRNPIDRSISNFLWIYERNILGNHKYEKISGILNKLYFYLFEDEEYAQHRNIQTRFICNSAQERIFSDDFFYTYGEYSVNWFLEDSNTDVNKAIFLLDSFEIVGITENHGIFMKKIRQWFKNNYMVNIPSSDLEHALKSKVHEDGKEVTTEDLKKMLSRNDTNRIITNNYMDYELHKYVTESL